MRNQFYSDKRDLVKWGSLLHLARSHSIKLILQTAYLRPDSVRFELSVSQSRNTSTRPVSPHVWPHFRDVRNIRHLQNLTGIRIQVFDDLFEDRDVYTESLLRWLRRYKRRKVVLLDPDTGIAPGKPSLKHVTPAEISRIFHVMKPRDILVLYQHARRTKTWLRDTRRGFARATGGKSGDIVTLRSPQVRDVAFFAATKPDASQP